ncbi:MAG: FAD-binding oxidoreductase [Actinomycetota bacterium]
MTSSDVVVIGGGIAGISAAARLAEQGAAVVLVEAEETLAFHTTGRSAAQYLENYGNDEVRKLTLTSKASLLPFLGPRPELMVGRESRVEALKAEVEHAKALVPTTEFLDGDQAREILPILRPEIAGALWEPDSKDIDVAGYHQSFVQRFRAAGGRIVTSAPVRTLTRADGRWNVVAGDHTLDAPVVVNAAGAWGDRVGALAGAVPLGLHPLRRTIAIAAIPEHFDPVDVQRWPITAFQPDDGSAMVGYCKPEPGGLLVSPADETLSEPCDAKPEELDVALGLHNLSEYTTLDIRHVRSTWAGLRTFTSDRTPVSGFDPTVDGFYWLVGQGGYGIHTSDALAQVAASNIGGTAWPDRLVELDLAPSHLAADRPGLAGPLTAGH